MAVEHSAEAVALILERFPEMAAERDFHRASFNASVPLLQPPGVRVRAIDCQS